MSRRIHSVIALVPLLALAVGGEARAGELKTWVLDPVHTQVVFFADHLGFSHGVGRLKIQQGWFQFDADDWSTARADVVIDMNSLDMGESSWTAKVLGRSFLDGEQFPTAHFIGKVLEKKTDATGILHGELWLLGVHQNVDLAVRFNREGGDPYAFKTKAGFTATTTLDRFAFGMKTYREVVAGPVELRIEVEGVRSSRDPKEPDSDAVEK